MVSEKVGSVPTLLLVASREQIRPVENDILVIILLPVKYLLKLSGSRNFYVLRMTSTNVFTISCLSIEPNPPPPASVNLFLQHGAKSLLHYSSTIRTIRRLFVDYSRTILTIRTIRRLFADYSYYSSTIRTIRTIRFTILVLSIALLCPINATSSFPYVFRLQYPRVLHYRIVPIEKLTTFVPFGRKNPPVYHLGSK